MYTELHEDATWFVRTLPGKGYGVHRVRQKECPIRPMGSRVVLWHSWIAWRRDDASIPLSLVFMDAMVQDRCSTIPSRRGTWVPAHYCIVLSVLYSQIYPASIRVRVSLGDPQRPSRPTSGLFRILITGTYSSCRGDALVHFAGWGIYRCIV